MHLGDRSHYTWALTGGKGSAMLSGPRRSRGGDRRVGGGTELNSRSPLWSDGERSWDADGAYQHTWARVHSDGGRKNTAGM